MNMLRIQTPVDQIRRFFVSASIAGDKAVAHLVAMLFFSGVLVALAVILEITLKSHWQAIVAALRNEPPVRRPEARPAIAPRPRHAAF